MTKLTLSLVGVIAVTGIAVSLAIWHCGQARLREKAEATRRQAEADSAIVGRERALVQPGRPCESSAIAHAGMSSGSCCGCVAKSGCCARPRRSRPSFRRRMSATARGDGGVRSSKWPRRGQPRISGPRTSSPSPDTLTRKQRSRRSLWAMNKGDVKAYLAGWASGTNVERAIRRRDLPGQGNRNWRLQRKCCPTALGPSIGFHILDKQVKSARPGDPGPLLRRGRQGPQVRGEESRQRVETGGHAPPRRR